jgi:hypothetical protein
MTFQVLNAAGVTTNIQALSINAGTVLTQSVPSDPLGNTMVASSFAVFAASGAPAPVAVKSAAGTLYGVNLYCNNTTNPVFLKFYNLATGNVTSGAIPTWTIGVPPGAPFNPPLPIAGVSFATAISYQITKLVASNDATAVGTNDLVGWIAYT